MATRHHDHATQSRHSIAQAPVSPACTPSYLRRTPLCRRGFSLLEVTIALSISGVLLSALWQLTAMAGQQREAAGLTSQALLVSAASKDYVSGQASTLLALPGLAALGNVVRVKITDSDTGDTANSVQGAGYLPQGFANLNSYGQSYALFVRREDGGTPGVADAGDRLIGLLLTTGGNAISDQMGARIAAGMGAPGGFVYSADTGTARGAAGGWQIDLSAGDWSSAGSVAQAGGIASLVNLLPAGGGGGGAKSLDDLSDARTTYDSGNSIFIGQNSGDAAASSALDNTGVGSGALMSLITGNENTALGTAALLSTTTGGANTAVGTAAMRENSTGNTNTAVGNWTLKENAGGSGNTAIGAQAMLYSLNGNRNTAVGGSALYSTKADDNTGIGSEALYSNTTGFQNTASGAQALRANTTGSYNTASGYQALYANTTANSNTALGSAALRNTTTGSFNTAVGATSLKNNTTGLANTAVGFNTLTVNTTARDNTAVGFTSMTANTTGAKNTAVGSVSLNVNTTGANNTAVGYQSLALNTTGANNAATGFESLYSNTTGCCNTAHGHQALRSNTIGIGNTAIGYFALFSNTTGGQNIALGYSALYSTNTGNNNIGIGSQALFTNTSGDLNTAINSSALIVNTTGSRNIAVGYEALLQSTSGNDNVALGTRAGFGNTTGSLNTFVGAQARTNATSYTNSTALGAYAIVTASNQVRIGDNNVTDIGGYAAWNNLSDRRMKHDIEPLDLGLDFVVRLQPKSYRMNNEPDGPVNFGFIAQDIAALLGERKSALVFQEPGEDGLWRYTSADMIAPVVKAIQEVHTETQAGLASLRETCLTVEAARSLIAAEVEKALSARHERR